MSRAAILPLLSLLLLLLLLSSLPPTLSLTLPHILSSHMVLQRDIPTTIWGTTPSPNTAVTATLDASTPITTTSNSAGNFSLTLPPHPSSTTPHTLTLTSPTSPTVTLTDILFGDVFLCSGQSNMEFVLQDAFNATAEVADSGHYPALRLFTVADDESKVYLNDTKSRFLKNESWVVSSPEYTNGTEWLYFSALCWLYGRDVHRALQQQVPVGLIESCYGGTPVETWSDVDAIDQCGAIKLDADGQPVQQQLTEEEQRLQTAVSNYGGPHGPKAPFLLWNAMIQPFIQYKLKAIIWYQGEDNVSNATSYACRFPAMIQSWRKHWQQPNLPFYFVLLAGYAEGGGHWAPTRAAQLAALALPYVDVSTAHDIGDLNNTVEGDIHSRNKSILATRMAALALHNLYNQTDVVAYGPFSAPLTWPTGNPTNFSIHLPFITTGAQGRYARGLHLLGTAECTECCSVAGSPVELVLSNKTTVRAAVRLVDDGLVAEVVVAQGVRVEEVWFNYEAYPQCALYNADGFPALPFAATRPATPTPHAGDMVQVKVSSLQPVSPPVAPNFIGFSLEWGIATSWTGKGHVRPSFVSLMRQLMHTPGQAGPTLRIGGDSATHSWYNPTLGPIPSLPYASGDYNITDSDLVSLGQGVKAINSSLSIGLNFRYQTNASWAVRHAQAVERLLGWEVVDSLEIGNEPELLSGRYRPANWTMADYYDEFELYTTQLQQALPRMPRRIFQGAVYASVKAWVMDLPAYVKRFQPLLRSISHHHYPTCADANPPPTMSDMLSEHAATKEAQFITTDTDNVRAKVEAAGVPFLCGEGNSACHSGMLNVSNVYGVTLWMLDSAFHSASVGLRRFYFHAHDREVTHYPALIWRTDGDDTPTVQPLYYALKMFAMATSHHAHVLPTAVSTTNGQVKVWVTYSPTLRAIRCVMLHKDLNATAPATVRVDLSAVMKAWGAGELVRLEAPSAYERYDIRLAGQTFVGSVDGEPVGQREVVRVNASASGVYEMEMAPISAALLTIQVPATAELHLGRVGAAALERSVQAE